MRKNYIGKAPDVMVIHEMKLKEKREEECMRLHAVKGITSIMKG